MKVYSFTLDIPQSYTQARNRRCIKQKFRDSEMNIFGDEYNVVQNSVLGVVR